MTFPVEGAPAADAAADALRAARAALDRLSQASHGWPVSRTGVVLEAAGTTLRAAGLDLRIGDVCTVARHDLPALRAEVVGVQPGSALLMPFGDLTGVQAGAQVQRQGASHAVPVSAHLLGRVIDGFGVPLDNLGPIQAQDHVPLRRSPPPALSRRPISSAVSTGIRAIDTMTLLGQGQRIGVFAPAGAGKTSLLGMMARHAQFDVNVIALVGERGRELGEFIDVTLGEQGLQRSVVVVATSDASAMERAKAAEVATAIAEYFRDALGLSVLLMMDSVTRYARALREIGLAAGEPPARRGYPASVFAELPKLLERSGNSGAGSITALYTILMEDEETADPIAEEIRSILDGHLMLTRKVAASGRYPALDIPKSLSRLMRPLAGSDHVRAADEVRALMAKYQDVELLVQVGEYQPGSDPAADKAIACHAELEAFFTQPMDECADFEPALDRLIDLVR